MSRLDEELSRAVAESEAEAPAAAKDVPPEPPPERPNKRVRNVGLLAALLAMGAAILALVFSTAPDAAVYSKSVDELLAEKERLASRNVRVVEIGRASCRERGQGWR